MSLPGHRVAVGAPGATVTFKAEETVVATFVFFFFLIRRALRGFLLVSQCPGPGHFAARKAGECGTGYSGWLRPSMILLGLSLLLLWASGVL